MGIDLVLCTVSPGRRAILLESPSVVEELMAARHDDDINGLVDLGSTWTALRVLILGDDTEGPIYEGLFGSAGEEIGEELSRGKKGRLLPAELVASIAKALAALPDDIVTARYDRLEKRAHGHGARSTAPGEPDIAEKRAQKLKEADLEVLGTAMERLLITFGNATRQGHEVLVAYVK
jgi:hypothetical protein